MKFFVLETTLRTPLLPIRNLYCIWETTGEQHSLSSVVSREWAGGQTGEPDDSARGLHACPWLGNSVPRPREDRTEHHCRLCWQPNDADLCNTEPLCLVCSLQDAKCSVIACRLMHRKSPSLAQWRWNGLVRQVKELAHFPHSPPFCLHPWSTDILVFYALPIHILPLHTGVGDY